MLLPAGFSIDTIKGFLDPAEGEELYRRGLECASRGPMLEIGSYCGKSTIYLASAAKIHDGQLFALDHHRGSEEHQPGEGYHDPDLFDVRAERMDSFSEFRLALQRSDLEAQVIPLVAPSASVARYWTMPLSLVFIDGGHALETAMTDYRCWAPHVQPGGVLLIHDLFDDPAEGGQAPITIYRLALASGLFEALPRVKTLGVLRRVSEVR